MTRLARVVATLVGVVSIGMGAAARQLFRASTDAVVLAVTVTDSHQKLVGGLDRSAFHVYENGIPQELAYFSRGPDPIALSILIDTSSSMDPVLPIARSAATGFVQQLSARDVAQVIAFNNTATVLQTFTHDPAALERAIHRTEAAGSTALYLAVYIALNDLKQIHAESPEELRRQVIVLLSDGEDTASLIDYDDLLEQAKRSNVAIYAIALKSKEDAALHEYNRSESDLRRLAAQTGGRVFVVSAATELPAVYRQIADELANQYVLAYAPANKKADGQWRQVTVRVDRPETMARTRLGYYAPAVPR